jgi:hypothetical protein
MKAKIINILTNTSLWNGEDITIARLRELLDQTKEYVKWSEDLKE